MSNWVEETTTSTTSPYTLSAVSGRNRFASVASGQQVTYSYAHPNGTDREAGIGTPAAGNTFAVLKVLSTLVSGTYTEENGGSAITAITKTSGGTFILTGLAARNNMDSYALGDFAGAGLKSAISKHLAPCYADLTATPLDSDDATHGLLRATLCYFDVDGEASGIAFKCNAAPANPTTVRLGLYSVGSDGLPNALIVACSTVSVGTTGVKQASFTGGFHIVPGWYYVLAFAYGTTADSVSMGSTSAGGVGSTPFGIDLANWNTASGYKLTQAYSAGLPSTAPSGMTWAGSPTMIEYALVYV